jgi:LPS export ABC transporter protein LptC
MSPRRIARLLAGVGAVALGAIVLVTVVVVHHRSTGKKLVTVAVGLVPGSLLHAHNFHWTQMKGDQSQWVLKAKDASYSDDKTSLTLIEPQLSMIASDGKQVALSASLARLKLEENHIKSANLTGGLVVHYGDFVVTTDAATFSPDTDQLEAPGAVKIESADMTVTGVGLSGHPKAEVFELHKQVTTRLTPRRNSERAKVS